MMKSDRGDPRLGWLEAFVATAHHLDFQLAANELGVDATNAKRGVEKLEDWLYRPLILEGPIELAGSYGATFLVVARRILDNFQSFTSQSAVPDRALSLAKSKRSGIRLSELDSFLSLARHKNYKASAYELGCSSDQVRRNVQKLERALGCKFVAGRSHIELTGRGRQFDKLAQNAATALRGCVADISNDDPAARALKDIQKTYVRRKVELTLIIARAGRVRKPTKRHISEAQAAREELVLLEKSLEAIRDLLSSRESQAE